MPIFTRRPFRRARSAVRFAERRKKKSKKKSRSDNGSGDHKIDVEHLFTHHWQLDQAEEAYRLFDTQTTGKGVFLM